MPPQPGARAAAGGQGEGTPPAARGGRWHVVSRLPPLVRSLATLRPAPPRTALMGAGACRACQRPRPAAGPRAGGAGRLHAVRRRHARHGARRHAAPAVRPSLPALNIVCPALGWPPGIPLHGLHPCPFAMRVQAARHPVCGSPLRGGRPAGLPVVAAGARGRRGGGWAGWGGGKEGGVRV
jgi:hypothetical protein